MFTETQVASYQQDGYIVARHLFSPAEAKFFIEHYMHLRADATYPGDSAGIPTPGQASAPDPWKQYPRMIHMHRWDAISLRWFLEPRLATCMRILLGNEPYAVQTMVYFKPPGGRGQALHQDQYYLRVQPGTCIAAWMALDGCDEENGCLRVVPGSHTLPVLCTTPADITQSVTDIEVPIPPGMQVRSVIMEPGDVLFFNGFLIHGSYPNHSQDRFRRALIGHYIVAEAEKVAQYFHPVLRMDGTMVEVGISERGSQCGVFVDQEGHPLVEMVTGSPS
jgi:phytanoyl-CoA hydroxylase